MLTLVPSERYNSMSTKRTNRSLLSTKIEPHTYWLAKALFSVLYPYAAHSLASQKGKSDLGAHILM